jgi:hypothetical protein
MDFFREFLISGAPQAPSMNEKTGRWPRPVVCYLNHLG